MFGLNAPLVFKTYQDVKNNLMYWTLVLLVASSVVIYFVILNQSQHQAIYDLSVLIGRNPFVATVSGILLLVALVLIAVVLIFGIQVHDIVYDKFIIKWREKYDVEFILAKLTEPIQEELPGKFLDFAARYRYEFMKPYYHFVGDGKPGIQENTRVRFYERVTWYWITQLNEIFILLFLVVTPVYVLAFPSGSMPINTLAVFVLILITLGLINRWLIKLTLAATAQATADEIEEILSKPENIVYLKEQYKILCTTHRL